MRSCVGFKKFGAGILAAILLLTQPISVVYAEETEEIKTEEQLRAEAEARQQASYDTMVDTNGLQNWPIGPNVYAESAIVMDMDSGAILYSKKADEQHYPASITKLLTVLVALENAEVTDRVMFSWDCVDFLEWGDASIGIKPGEEIGMEDALYGILLASANEVSYAVAKNVGEKMGVGYEGFIEKMNERAKELGCTNSHWMNANGLHDEQHYTTAHDMAVIASAVYQQDEFRKIEECADHTIGVTNITNEERVFQQNHKLLIPYSEYYYEYAKAGKTGYTDQSGTTLVTMADNGNMRLAAVVLCDYGLHTYTDTIGMFEYVFNNFKKVKLSEMKQPEGVAKILTEDASVVIPNEMDITALDCEIVKEKPEDEKDTLATATYTYQGQNVGSAKVKLDASSLKEKNEEKQSKETENQSVEKKTWKTYLPLIVMGVIVGLIFGIFLPIWLRLERRRKSRRRRKRLD